MEETGPILIIVVIALVLWLLLGPSFNKKQKPIRRFFLFIFIIAFFPLYHQITTWLKEQILINFDLNYTLSKVTDEFKGTDWADGLLTATFIALYIWFSVSLWNREKKISKKKDDNKPIKIEAKIGDNKD